MRYVRDRVDLGSDIDAMDSPGVIYSSCGMAAPTSSITNRSYRAVPVRPGSS